MTEILYHCDFDAQFADATHLQQAHTLASNMTKRREDVAGQPGGSKPKKVAWQMGIFWEHVRERARMGLMFSVPANGQPIGTTESIDAFFSRPVQQESVPACADGWSADDDMLNSPHPLAGHVPEKLFFTVIKAAPSAAKLLRVSPGHHLTKISQDVLFGNAALVGCGVCHL